MDEMLFSPIKINSLTVPNRFVRSATQDYYANDDGSVSENNMHLYEKLDGMGLIISGFIYVSENGKCTSSQFGLYEDKLTDSFKRLTDKVHEAGNIIFAQLVHGGRQVRLKYVKGTIWAPSVWEPHAPDAKILPKEMSDEDILRVIDDFTNSVKRAFNAGFDGVQFHSAHGYLLSQFLSPYTNRRIDQWGGALENRIRVTLEILKRSRAETGKDYPLIIKLNGDDGGIKGGLTIDDASKAAVLLEEGGIDAIEVSRSMMESPEPAVKTDITREEDEAYLLDQALKIKKNVKIPVISVGGYRSVAIMENALKEGKCDMVSLSRPFIREPDLVKKILRGKNRADCISCNKCFNIRGIKCVYVDD